MPAAASADVGRLILRLAVGALILLHGIAKLRSGVGPIGGMLASHGLPPVLAYGAYVGEVMAPVLLIVGLWTRAAAALVAVNMLFALGLAHLGDLATLQPKTGGWAVELQMMYLWSAVAIVLLGAGRFSLGGAGGRLN
jgi:putative oxidoreductase